MSLSPGRSLAFTAALLAVVTVGPAPVMAQNPEAKPPEVKNWPKQDLWQAQLVRLATGPYLCMLNAIGSDPHPFGVSFIETPQRIAFMVDDREPGLHYLPTMTVYVDEQEVGTYPTFNDPPMTSTAPSESPRVKVLMTRLAQGQMLKVEARRMTYTLPLQGFAEASGQFAAASRRPCGCRAQRPDRASDPAAAAIDRTIRAAPFP
jgi:hypothetical protein